MESIIMKSYMKSILEFAIIVLFILDSSHAYGKDPEQDFKYPQDQFSVSLPAEWVEIPGNILDAYSRSVNELQSGNVKVHYDYGFQPAPVKKWLSLPYILMTVEKTGRLKKGDIDDIVSRMKRQINSRESDYPSVLSDLNAQDVLYDRELKTIWMSMIAENDYEGKIHMMSGMYLTNYGYVHLACAVRDDEYPLYADVFKHILKNVKIDDSARYKDRLTDSLGFLDDIPWKLLINTLIGALVGLAIYIFVFERRKGKRDDK